jgi:hypothetical protein
MAKSGRMPATWQSETVPSSPNLYLMDLPDCSSHSGHNIESTFPSLLMVSSGAEAHLDTHPTKTLSSSPRMKTFSNCEAGFVDACHEWIKGCSCAPRNNPGACEECTQAFLKSVLERARTHGLMIGSNAIPTCEEAFKDWYFYHGADYNASHVKPVWEAAWAERERLAKAQDERHPSQGTSN